MGTIKWSSVESVPIDENYPMLSLESVHREWNCQMLSVESVPKDENYQMDACGICT